MDCSTPGFPVLHYLLELAHTYVHRVDNAIQPSHSLSSPSPLALNFSQHQSLFQGAGASRQVVKVLELQLQHQFFQWIYCSVAQSCPTLCDPMDCSTPGFPVIHYLPELALSIESMRPSNHLILCHPLILPSVFPSIKVFSSELALCIRWPKYWSFSFSISPSNEYLGLISFRMDWLDLLAVQRTLKSLLQHHRSKASIPQCSAFFVVQLSHLYMTTGKTIGLTVQNFLDKAMWCLCFLKCYPGLS